MMDLEKQGKKLKKNYLIEKVKDLITIYYFLNLQVKYFKKWIENKVNYVILNNQDNQDLVLMVQMYVSLLKNQLIF